eukprot:scaffold140293_cov63-Cyclotella_meneghiniana.AAC.1
MDENKSDADAASSHWIQILTDAWYHVVMMHRGINCEKIPKHSRWCHDVLEGVDIKTYGVNIARE